jgi:hypothetical protein
MLQGEGNLKNFLEEQHPWQMLKQCLNKTSLEILKLTMKDSQVPKFPKIQPT